MDVDCEGSDISEAIPHCPADSEVDWLYFHCQPEAVQLMGFRNVRSRRAQCTSYRQLTRVRLDPRHLGDEFCRQRPPEATTEGDLSLLGACSGQGTGLEHNTTD